MLVGMGANAAGLMTAADMGVDDFPSKEAMREQTPAKDRDAGDPANHQPRRRVDPPNARDDDGDDDVPVTLPAKRRYDPENIPDARPPTPRADERERSDSDQDDDADGGLTDEEYGLGEALGYTRKQIERFGSSKAWHAHLRTIAEQSAARAKPTQDGERTAKPKRVAPDLTKLKLELPADAGYDEEQINISKANKQLHEYYHAEIADLKGTIETMAKRLQETDARDTRKRLDSMFTSIEKDYGDVFGKGDSTKLGKDEKGFRNAVIETMDELEEIGRRRGKSIPEERLFDRAVRIVTSEQADQIATKKVSRKLRDNAGQFIAPSTDRRERPATPEQKAIAGTAKILQRAGLPVY